ERAHLAIISENRVQWGIAYLTGMTFNYVVVPIDKNLPEQDIINILHESEAEAIVFSNSYDDLMRDKKDLLKKLKVFVNMDLPAEKNGFYSMTELINAGKLIDEENLPLLNPEEMAEINFTSGSLGRAKGVMLSQRNIAENLMSMTSMIEITYKDRFLSVLPIHHTYECTCGFLCPLYMGGSAHYARSLKTVVEDMQRVKPTILLSVPLMYDKMFKKIYKTINEDKVKSRIVPPLIKITNLAGKIGWKSSKKLIFKELHHRFGGSIRLFIAGAAAPDPKVAKGLREFGFNFVQGYGLTETSPILALNQIDNFKDMAAGLPLKNVHLKINEPNSEGIGEIYAKGPNVMLGYYKNPQLTQEVFDGEWFMTGDLGYIDSDGFLHIVGRKKNVIISRTGENVYPEEIEDVLNRSPYIKESLVYGEEDEKHDEIIAAQIVTEADSFIEYSQQNNLEITDELIKGIIDSEIKLVNRQLPLHKQIRKFNIRTEEFEKTTTQKIKRYLVRKEKITNY
ncbi:MAG TPA: AMP-binding protein, partial [Ignavibacteriaceae bacterium]|nr:AMP-binding protein [Ignavibacteriaceae bacterium]